MARNQGNRGGNRSGRNNNPEGRNQYSGGMVDMARERPITAALGAAAAVGAGVFLWSRRNQISDQLSNLSEQITDWAENMRSGEDSALSFEDSDQGTDALVSAKGGRSSRGKTQQEFAEEALTLKETGGSASRGGRNRPRQQPIG
jgi:hypothetical protein